MLVAANTTFSRQEAILCRLFDVLVAAAALVVLAPLMLMLAVVVFLDCRGTILALARLGSQGRTFNVLTFRSACVGAERTRNGSPRSARSASWGRAAEADPDFGVSWFGRFLRSSGLDELPQLLNVLRGDMSIVGPRPIAEAERERYGDLFAIYCSARPGLTGISQLSGRNDLTYQERIEMNALYARKKCLRLDLSLLVIAMPRVLLARVASYVNKRIN